jgi:hypothetical protein
LGIRHLVLLRRESGRGRAVVLNDLVVAHLIVGAALIPVGEIARPLATGIIIVVVLCPEKTTKQLVDHA